MQTLVASARCLAHRLSEYSQSNMVARWLEDLEFMVWQDLADGTLVEGLLVSPEGIVLPPLDEAEKEEFRQLSEAIGGWVVYDSEDAQDRAAFVPLAEWTTRYNNWLERVKQAVAEVNAATGASAPRRG